MKRRGKLMPGVGPLMADRLLRTVIELTVGLWMARYLGPASFGDLSYALAVVAIVGPVTSMGLHGLLVRELVSRPSQAGTVLGAAATLRMIGGLISVGFVVTVGISISDPARSELVLVLALVVPLQVVEVFDLYLQATGRMGSSALARSGAAVLAGGSRVGLILAAAGVVPFAWTYLVEAAVWGGVLTVLAHRSGLLWPGLQVSTGEMRRLFSDSWPLIVSGFGAVLNLKVDQAMLGTMASAEELGVYAAAARLSEAIYFVPAVLVTAAFPGIIRARNEDRKDYGRRLDRLFRTLLALAGGAVASGLLLGPWLIPRLLGAEFQPSVPIFQIHLWGAMAAFPGVLMSRWLIAEGLTPFSTVRHAGGAAINVALNALLIPHYGGVGSAWATLISYVAASYLLFFVSHKTRPAAVRLTRAIVWFPIVAMRRFWTK